MTSNLPPGAPVTLPAWGPPYPSPEALKAEVRAMLDAVLQAILGVVPAREIEHIHAKGSALKPWATPVDYVPELSDVDVHLHFRDDAGMRYLSTMEQALDLQARIEHSFRESVPSPVHFPRPQLMVANHLVKQPGFVPSPAGTVTVLYGSPYPRPHVDEADSRQIDRERMLEHEEFLAGLPMHAVDNPGRYLWSVLRLLTWRVSPVAPRVLSLLGVSYEEAWSANRTGMIKRLVELGQEPLAADYAAFYLHGWEYFLSGHQDGDAGRRAVLAGARALRGGIEFAKSVPAATTAPPAATT